MKQRLLSFLTAQRVLCALVLALALPEEVAHAQLWAAYAHADFLTPMINKRNFERHFELVKKRQQCGPAGVNAAGSCIQGGGRALPSGASVASLRTGKGLATTEGIQRLVASIPAQYQPEAAKMFTTLILTFDNTIPRTYGIPADNLASAYTAVLAGSYAAYTNQPFPDNAVKPLFQQMQQAMLDEGRVSQASMNDKNIMYQELVGIGMFMVGWQAHLAKHPDPEQQAKMQKAGANALHALSVDPNRVRFTNRGMEFL